jgi:hypothetical protein
MSEAKQIQARLRAKVKASKHDRFTSWSFSRYSEYRQCPKKAFLHHIAKVEEPSSAPMMRGSVIGKLAEMYIRGEVKLEARDVADFVAHYREDESFIRKLTKAVASGKLLPDELSKFSKTFKALRAQRKKRPQSMVVEDMWAFDGAWGPSRWDDWTGCVVRVKIDCGHLDGPKVFVVTDWKTGKYRAERRAESMEQLELYALGALLKDVASTIKVRLAYLDAGVIFPEPGSQDEREMTFTQADLPRLKKAWDKRTRAMLLDRSFAARPNALCNWCWYRKENTPNLPGKVQLCKY